MHHVIKQPRFCPFVRFIAVFLILTFSSTTILPPGYAQTIGLSLPIPGTMVGQSPAFVPVLLKGMTVHPDNPLQFDFVIDSGNENLKKDELKKESERLVKYFLASMTVPQNDLWVNLSPYEKDRIIPDELAKTELGRDLLAQDYILKQLTATMMYPEEELGKKFWDRVWKKVETQHAASSKEIQSLAGNTFNKVWILPERAEVYEYENTVYITDSHLKVMLDSDYEAMANNSACRDGACPVSDNALKSDCSDGACPVSTKNNDVSGLTKQIIREIILPEIEKEVNTGRNFATIRQIYHSLILAKWYKQTVKNSIMSQVYIDQNKTAGIETGDTHMKEGIYDRYMQAYKKGVFNYIKEDYDELSQTVIPRQYFSGGFKDKAMVVGRTDNALKVAGVKVGNEYRLPVAFQPEEGDKAMLVKVTEADRAKTEQFIKQDNWKELITMGPVAISAIVSSFNKDLHPYRDKTYYFYPNQIFWARALSAISDDTTITRLVEELTLIEQAALRETDTDQKRVYFRKYNQISTALDILNNPNGKYYYQESLGAAAFTESAELENGMTPYWRKVESKGSYWDTDFKNLGRALAQINTSKYTWDSQKGGFVALSFPGVSIIDGLGIVPRTNQTSPLERQLADAVERLKNKMPGLANKVAFLPYDSFHATILDLVAADYNDFKGKVGSVSLEELQPIIERVAAEALIKDEKNSVFVLFRELFEKGFPAIIIGIDAFPGFIKFNIKTPNRVSFDLLRAEIRNKIKKEIEAQMGEEAARDFSEHYPPSKLSFSPHISIGYIVEPLSEEEITQLSQILKEINANFHPISIRLNSGQLMDFTDMENYTVNAAQKALSDIYTGTWVAKQEAIAYLTVLESGREGLLPAIQHMLWDKNWNVHIAGMRILDAWGQNTGLNYQNKRDEFLPLWIEDIKTSVERKLTVGTPLHVDLLTYEEIVKVNVHISDQLAWKIALSEGNYSVVSRHEWGAEVNTNHPKLDLYIDDVTDMNGADHAMLEKADQSDSSAGTSEQKEQSGVQAMVVGGEADEIDRKLRGLRANLSELQTRKKGFVSLLSKQGDPDRAVFQNTLLRGVKLEINELMSQIDALMEKKESESQSDKAMLSLMPKVAKVMSAGLIGALAVTSANIVFGTEILPAVFNYKFIAGVFVGAMASATVVILKNKEKGREILGSEFLDSFAGFILGTGFVITMLLVFVLFVNLVAGSWSNVQDTGNIFAAPFSFIWRHKSPFTGILCGAFLPAFWLTQTVRGNLYRLRNGSLNAEEHAIRKLGDLKSKHAVEELIKELLSSVIFEIRREAAEALGKVADKRAFEALTKALSDSDEIVRGLAVGALGRLGDKHEDLFYLREAKPLITEVEKLTRDLESLERKLENMPSFFTETRYDEDIPILGGGMLGDDPGPPEEQQKTTTYIPNDEYYELSREVDKMKNQISKKTMELREIIEKNRVVSKKESGKFSHSVVSDSTTRKPTLNFYVDNVTNGKSDQAMIGEDGEIVKVSLEDVETLRKIVKAKVSKMKMVVFAFDGTLVGKDRTLESQPEIAKLIIKLLALGKGIIIATGQDIMEVQDHFVEVLKKHPEFKDEYLDQIHLYGSSGAVGINARTGFETPYYKLSLEKSLIDEFRLFADEQGWLNNPDYFVDINEFQIRVMRMPKTEASHETAVEDSVPIKEWLKKKGYEVSIAMGSLSCMLSPLGADKAKVMEDVYQRFDVDDDTLIKVGDLGNKDGNDFELLKYPNSFTVDKFDPDNPQQVRVSEILKLSKTDAAKILLELFIEALTSDSINRQNSNADIGGIDMNEIDIDRQTSTESGSETHTIKFEMQGMEPLLNMDIQGFSPVIIDMIPINSVLPLLGLMPTEKGIKYGQEEADSELQLSMN